MSQEKIRKVLKDLLSHKIGMEDAVQNLSQLSEPKKENKSRNGCICKDDEIFFDDELEIIFCSCGKFLLEENEGTLKKHGLYDAYVNQKS